MKKILGLTFVILIVFGLVVTNAAFSDVESHWAKTFITELTSKKILNGYPDGTFKPNNVLTKGEFMKLIMQASLPEFDFLNAPKNFEHWAASYVYVAESYGILEAGAINLDNINQPINRIDVIQILGLCDVNIRGNKQKTKEILPFSDINDISNIQIIMLGHAVESEIISGYPDGTFKPYNNLTRGEVSKILFSYMGL